MVLDFLKGKKSYIVAALGVLVAGLHATGHMSDDLFKTLMALLGSGAVATVRAALERVRTPEDR